MSRMPSAAAMLTVLMATAADAQQTFHCETTEGRAQARIVGGRGAEITDWSWQVALVKGTASKGRAFNCGGSIISPRWILTAAHCLFDKKGTLSTELEVVHGRNRPLSYEGIRADRLIPHPGYDPGTTDLENDIALIRLVENIPNTLPIQLSSGRLDDIFARPETCATVVGWGRTAEDPQSSVGTLRQAYLPILKNSDCAVAYPGEVTDSHICAGYPQGGVDSCQGDSGGPLMVRHGESSRYVQVGVVSWGKGCARPGFPGIYTRVSSYIDWIQSHTGR